jgi:hypothetical protein
VTGARWVHESTIAVYGFERWFLIQDGVPEDEAEVYAWASVEYPGWDSVEPLETYTAELHLVNWPIRGEERENEYSNFKSLEDAQRWCEVELTLNEVHFP